MRTSRDEGPGQGDTPAPVITHEGTWGTPPPAARMRRPERRAEARAWATLMLAALVAVWVSALALSQLTARDVALPVAERGIAAVTEIDALLTLHEADLCAAARPGDDRAIDLAGFAVHDVLLRANEIPCADGVLDHARLRGLVLSRAGELVYLRGSAAFSKPGGAADSAPVLSSPWAIRLLLDSIGAGLHEWASLAAWASGSAVVLAAALALMLGRRGGRVARVGWALVLGATPVALGSGAAWVALAVTKASGRGVMLDEFAAIGQALVALPARDALLVVAAGLALVAPRLLATRRRG